MGFLYQHLKHTTGWLKLHQRLKDKVVIIEGPKILTEVIFSHFSGVSVKRQNVFWQTAFWQNVIWQTAIGQ